jgi:hypothetical protein
MSQKFKSDIEVQAGIRDSSGAIGTSGQVLSSTGSNVSWINQTTVASDVQNLVKAGVAINKGQAVYVTGADGTNIIVGLASNTSEATSSKTLGLLNATVAINGMADVVQIGRLAGLNTIGATAGDPVWLGTNGNLIYGLINKPYAPAHLVFLGIVTRVNANNGEIFVNVQNGFELKEIHDVDIITNVPINGDILGFNGTLWVNKTIAQWLGYTPANASGTTNYVSKFTGTTTLGNSQIFDNGVGVGINTTSPNYTTAGRGIIDINGSSQSMLALSVGGAGKSFLFYTGTDLLVSNESNGSIKFNTNGSEKAIITSSGNVGIGTTSPIDKLEVNGGIRSTGLNGFTRINDGVLSASRADGLYLIQEANAPMIMWTNNTERMRISANGAIKFNNYGSGTFTGTPTQRLAVDSSGNVIEIPIGGGAVDGSGTTNYVTKWTDADTIGNSQIFDTGTNVGIGTTNPNYQTAGRLVVDINGSSQSLLGFSIGTNPSAYIASTSTLTELASVSNPLLFTVGSERMRITSSGNVGIGTTAPSEKLDVYGVVRGLFSGNPGTGGITGKFLTFSPAPYGLTFRGYGTGTHSIQVQRESNDAEVFSLSLNPNGGSVGIGTTTPGAKLHVVGEGIFDDGVNGRLTLGFASSQNDIYSTTTGFGGWKNFRISSNELILSTGGTNERMRITSAGNVGIGTTSPSGLLHLYKNNSPVVLRLQSASPYAYPGDFSIQTGGYGSNDFIIYDNISSVERLYINLAGNVGIGTSNPAKILDVNGDALINDLTVGRGGGNVSTNTALGHNTLVSNASGTNNIAIGYNASQNSDVTGLTVIGSNLYLNTNANALENDCLAISQYNSNTTSAQLPHIYAPKPISLPPETATDIITFDYAHYAGAIVEYLIRLNDGSDYAIGTVYMAWKDTGNGDFKDVRQIEGSNMSAFEFTTNGGPTLSLINNTRNDDAWVRITVRGMMTN